MAFKNLIAESSAGIGTITINRPDVLNALNFDTVCELEEAVKTFATDTQVRVVVITGAGDKAFVAGADIAAMREMTAEQADGFAKKGHSAMRAIEECGKPVIAAVNGFALGGGTELAIACDFIYAAETAKFGLPEVKLGLYPGFGGTQRLWRIIGPSRAKEMIFSGRIIDAKMACEWGIVNRVFPAAELKEQVTKMAEEIAANGPVAISAAKRLINSSMNMTLDRGLESECQMFRTLFTTEDMIEGLSAFLEKRKPSFKGR